MHRVCCGMDRMRRIDEQYRPDRSEKNGLTGAFDPTFDLIIIGAGPAGLFCAISSARPDRRVLVLEKNSFPGRKLLITGSCHCNLTHDGDVQAFLDHYGDHGRFLRPALQNFTNRELIAFFEERELAMIREESGKIFPATMRSKDVLKVLTDELESNGIRIECGQDVKSVSKTDEGFTVRCKNHHGKDHVYQSRLLVMATGGMSYPATGSTGDGYALAGWDNRGVPTRTTLESVGLGWVADQLEQAV